MSIFLRHFAKQFHFPWLFHDVGWLVVFNVPSTVRSFRDGTPIYCPLRRTWSSINTPFRPSIEPRAVAWQSTTLPLCYASSTWISLTCQSLFHQKPPPPLISTWIPWFPGEWSPRQCKWTLYEHISECTHMFTHEVHPWCPIVKPLHLHQKSGLSRGVASHQE